MSMEPPSEVMMYTCTLTFEVGAKLKSYTFYSFLLPKNLHLRVTFEGDPFCTFKSVSFLHLMRLIFYI